MGECGHAKMERFGKATLCRKIAHFPQERPLLMTAHFNDPFLRSTQVLYWLSRPRIFWTHFGLEPLYYIIYL